MKPLISLTKTIEETNLQKITLKKDPLISVVMPAYNEGEHIAEAIAHISGQLNVNGHRFEIIVVDDGSKDDTYNIVKKLDTKNLHTLRLRKKQRQRNSSETRPRTSKRRIRNIRRQRHGDQRKKH